MGVIKEGRVSGTLPKDEAFAIHYPGYPKTTSRAIQTLGGTEGILKANFILPFLARNSQPNRLELHFRPGDPYSHPAFGELSPCNSLLLKISKKKCSNRQTAEASRMADYQHVLPVHANAARKRKGNWVEAEEASFEKGGFMDVDQEDVMMILPPLFSPKDMPENVVLRPSTILSSKKNQEVAVHYSAQVDLEPGLAIDFNIKDILLISFYLSSGFIFCFPILKVNMLLVFTSYWLYILLHLIFTFFTLKKIFYDDSEILPWSSVQIYSPNSIFLLDLAFVQVPKNVNWEEHITQDSEQWEWQMTVSKLFEERPIWPKESVTERLLQKGLKFSHLVLKRLLLGVAYYFSNGPFRRFWIRKGYDPRKDPESRIYQRTDFRVPEPLRNYADASVANLTHKWGDLCSFQVFPYKFQMILQLFELDDDYIQQEIRKPPKLETCDPKTGWFSECVLDCLRLRVAMRFLSVYPKTGAESILKSCSNEFEKLKRSCLYKDVFNSHQEEHQQTNKGSDKKCFFF
ncbi:hypothetical protein GOBAR_AA35430 [Gossypium barbadense]|uniref:Transcription factor IIIC subunit 5 HTH domain-containing protein n=1 Tax=Gossypium barbadense TaxID=3634 RepID=A0A2P5W2D4_GOSBA|nr:hypothetical protein GOBAR_AA35430 [Gossypium barbadense]